MDTRHERINFRDLSDTKLPIFRKKKSRSKKGPSQTLFPIEIVNKEPDKCRVKVHYIRYGSNFNEWKDESKLEVLDEERPLTCQSSIQHYCLFKDLSIKIKRALSCSRKASPEAKIVMSFDILLFNGGLLPTAIPSRSSTL